MVLKYVASLHPAISRFRERERERASETLGTSTVLCCSHDLQWFPPSLVSEITLYNKGSRTQSNVNFTFCASSSLHGTCITSQEAGSSHSAGDVQLCAFRTCDLDVENEVLIWHSDRELDPAATCRYTIAPPTCYEVKYIYGWQGGLLIGQYTIFTELKSADWPMCQQSHAQAHA